MIQDKLIKNIVYVTLFCIGAVIILHGFLLQGFLADHNGWAGPHLLSTALNMQPDHAFVRANMVFLDGGLVPYNHHPPLYFLLQKSLSFFTSDVIAILNASYVIASVFMVLGVWTIYLLLRKFSYSRLISVTATVIVASASMWLKYQMLITFDSTNVFLAALFMYYLSDVLKDNDKQSFRRLYYFCVIAILISWYVIMPIFIAGLWLLYKQWDRQRFTKCFSQPEFLFCIGTALWAVSLTGVLLLQEYIGTGRLSSLAYAFSNDVLTGVINDVPKARDRDFVYILLIFIRDLLSLGNASLIASICVVASIVFCQTGFDDLFQRLKIKQYMSISVGLSVLGTALFILATMHWSVVHPFAFLWFIPSIAVVTAMLLDIIFSKYKVIVYGFFIVALIGFGIKFSHKNQKEYKQAEERRALYTWIKNRQGQQPINFQVAQLNNHVDQSCGVYTEGVFFFTAHYPNTISTAEMPQSRDGYETLRWVCEKPADTSRSKGNLLIVDEDGVVVFNAKTYLN